MVATLLLQAFAAIAWATAACLLLRNPAGRSRTDLLLGCGLVVGAGLQALDTLTVRGTGVMPLLPWALLATAAWCLLPRPGSTTLRAEPWRVALFGIGLTALLHVLHEESPLQPVWSFGLHWRPIELPAAILAAVMAQRVLGSPAADHGRLGQRHLAQLLAATGLGSLAVGLGVNGCDAIAATLQLVGVLPFVFSQARTTKEQVPNLAAIVAAAVCACLLRADGLQQAMLQQAQAGDQGRVAEQLIPDAATTVALAAIAEAATAERTAERARELTRLFGERAAAAEQRVAEARAATMRWRQNALLQATAWQHTAGLLAALGGLFAVFGLTLGRRAPPGQPGGPPQTATTTPTNSGIAAAPMLVPLDNVLARVGHELRTPLTTILGAAELLQEHGDAEQARAHAKTIVTHGRRLGAVLAQVEDLERLCRAELSIAGEPFALDKIITDAVDAARPTALDKGVDVRMTAAADLPRWVHGDARRIRQMLAALLEQAVAATRIGAVDLRISKSDTGVTFVVQDEGPGLAEDQAETFFDTFYAVAPSDTPTAQLNLGLVLAKRLALTMGGDLTVHPRIGHGCEFRLALPLRSAEDWEIELEQEPKQTTDAPMAWSNRSDRLRGRVLLVEDSPDHQLVLCRMLQKTGVDVALAENGIVALHLLEHDSFDLVLMDMQMPEMDGLTAVRRIRERGDQTPVIALTADALSGDAEHCLSAGCNGHLPKPTDRATLAATLAMYLPVRDGADRN
ncbi:MAG: response regulator [Planctomycetes bacterium]|nr:response regulator [Planctomycetota bacterium]